MARANRSIFLLGLWLFLMQGASAAAPVLSNGWARATVSGQSAGAAFFSVQSDEPVRITAVSTSVAKLAELHQMAMTGGVMTMRQIDGIDVPKSGKVDLTPNGMHVMLFELSHPLIAGQHFTLNVTLRDASGKSEVEPVDIAVRALGQ
jgi:copper(I)-binding protein